MFCREKASLQNLGKNQVHEKGTGRERPFWLGLPLSISAGENGGFPKRNEERTKKDFPLSVCREMLNRTAAILVSLSEAFFHCEAKGGRGGGVGGGRGSAGVGVYSGEGMMDFLTKKTVERL